MKHYDHHGGKWKTVLKPGADALRPPAPQSGAHSLGCSGRCIWGVDSELGLFFVEEETQQPCLCVH